MGDEGRIRDEVEGSVMGVGLGTPVGEVVMVVGIGTGVRCG
jgi:hypothetical protein